MNREALKYSERILRIFMSGESWRQELIDGFHAWLVNGEHCPEKDLAARRIFYEFMDQYAGSGETTEMPDSLKKLIGYAD